MKNKNLLLGFILGGGLLFASYEGKSQMEPQTETSDSTNVTEESDVTELSLEDLMNIKVSVASKKSETVADAPGSITAYSNKDIEKLGYYTLGDLGSITAGYSSFKGIGETTFETRGQMQSGFDNNKHLVLVDGIPVNHARANMAPAEENLTLFFAQRVEFLRGTGSALYGTSAFSGVINIVSKDLEENGTLAESKFSLGNYDFKRRIMANIFHRSDAGISKLSVSYFGKDATRQYLGNGMFPNANSTYNDNVNDIFINASHKLSDGPLKGLGAGLIYMRKTGGLGEFWMFQQNQTLPINQITWEEIIPYLKYERSLTNKLSLNSYLKGNMSTENAYTMGYQQIVNPAYGSLIGSGYNVRVLDKEGLAELKYSHSEKTNIIGGVNVISRYSTGAPETYAFYAYATPGVSWQPDPTYFRRSSTYNIYSVYSQLQHTIDFLKGLNITAGARWDIGRVYSAENGTVTNKYDQISPRIALVQKVTDKFNLKAMYGKALRAPLIKEVGLNEETRNAALSNPALAPYAHLVPNVNAESIWSLEGGATYNTNKVSLAVTVFYNETLNSLGSINILELSNARVFTNLPGVISSKGFETEATYMPTKNIKIGANYSRAHAIYRGDDLANVPTGKLNGVLTYTMYAPVKISATLVGRWIENYRSGVVNGFILGNNFATNNSLMSGYKVVDLNLVGEVTKNISLELQFRNLLDSKIITPTGIISSGMLNVPYPGRTFLATVGFKF